MVDTSHRCPVELRRHSAPRPGLDSELANDIAPSEPPLRESVLRESRQSAPRRSSGRPPLLAREQQGPVLGRGSSASPQLLARRAVVLPVPSGEDVTHVSCAPAAATPAAPATAPMSPAAAANALRTGAECTAGPVGASAAGALSQGAARATGWAAAATGAAAGVCGSGCCAASACGTARASGEAGLAAREAEAATACLPCAACASSPSTHARRSHMVRPQVEIRPIKRSAHRLCAILSPRRSHSITASLQVRVC